MSLGTANRRHLALTAHTRRCPAKIRPPTLPDRPMLFRRLAIPLALLLLTACATKPPVVYRLEKFEADKPFTFHSDLPPLVLCELGKRALLSQGYEVDATSPQAIRGTKFFQPQLDYQVQLKVTLVCLPSKDDTTLYANALQTRFELKSSSSSTGLSVAGLGSISLPWPADKSALVKVAEETIGNPKNYHRLF